MHRNFMNLFFLKETCRGLCTPGTTLFPPLVERCMLEVCFDLKCFLGQFHQRELFKQKSLILLSPCEFCYCSLRLPMYFSSLCIYGCWGTFVRLSICFPLTIPIFSVLLNYVFRVLVFFFWVYCSIHLGITSGSIWRKFFTGNNESGDSNTWFGVQQRVPSMLVFKIK